MRSVQSPLRLGVLVGAYIAVRHGARRTVAALRRVLDLSEPELAKLEAATGGYSRYALSVAAVIGLVIAFLSPYLVPPVPAAPWHPRSWSPEVAWHRILGPLMGILTGWFGYALIVESRRLSRLAESLKPIDLLDIRPLNPFTRLGLRNALLTVGYLAIVSLLLLDSGFSVLVSILGIATLIVAVLALVVPVHGVHLRIRGTKEAELAWSRARIRAARADLLSGEGRERGELADLVAYHGLIESVREWPFDVSTYVRFALYLLLPLAAWLTGALAEGVVQSAFADLL